MGILVALVLRIVLLFVIMSLLETFASPLFSVHWTGVGIPGEGEAMRLLSGEGGREATPASLSRFYADGVGYGKSPAKP